MVKMIEYQEKMYKVKENQTQKWPNFQKNKVAKKKSTKAKEIRLKSGQIFKTTKLKVSKHSYQVEFPIFDKFP